jgi:hypothetical protein
MKKGSSKCISIIAKRVVPQSWDTSNGTFIIDMGGDIEISLVECSHTHMRTHPGHHELELR